MCLGNEAREGTLQGGEVQKEATERRYVKKGKQDGGKGGIESTALALMRSRSLGEQRGEKMKTLKMVRR